MIVSLNLGISSITSSVTFTQPAYFCGLAYLVTQSRFAKDALGRPLYADGFSADRRTFSYNGYMFVSSTLVPVGEILGYDSSKIDVTTYKPYRVEIGWVNDDFIKNQFVILGESRGHIHIREHDKRSFIKATIADVISDIEAPEAPETP